MTLHPQAAAAVAAHEPLDPAITSLAAYRARVIERAPALVDLATTLSFIRDARTPRGIPVRIYVSDIGAAAPVCVYMHGGGWVFGGIDTVDELCRRLARYSGCTVVSVEYSKSPESQYPAAVDDVIETIQWIRAGGPLDGIDCSRIGVAGDSAGAYLALAAAMRLRDDGAGLQAQALAFPAIEAVPIRVV